MAALAAWSRVLNAADKLFQAADDLDDLGGAGRLARDWKPRPRLEKSVADGPGRDEALGSLLGQLEAARPRPNRKPMAPPRSRTG